MTTAAEKKAEAFVTALKERLSEHLDHKAELQEQIDDVAFEALAENNPAAMKRLEQLTEQLIRHDFRGLAMQAATREAEARVEIASGAAREDLLGRDAEAALALGRGLADAMKAMDRGFNQAYAASNDAHEIIHELNALGCGPQVRLFVVNVLKAIATLSMATPFKVQHLAPVERVSLNELATSYGRTVTAWAEQRLPSVDKAA